MTNSTQNHIHLSLELGNTPEFAPSITWHLKSGTRRDIPRIFVALDESIDGTLQAHVLTDGFGPVRRRDFKGQLIVAATETQTIEERLDSLIEMFGQPVKFCDVIHVADGQDHTYNIREMFFSQMGDVSDFEPSLLRFYVDIFLQDNSS